MIGQEYTITNQNGDSIIINDHTTDPDRIIALQTYPTFDMEIRNEEIKKEGQHGIWDFNSYYGKRLISFQGVIAGLNEADVETIKSKLLSVTQIPLQPSVGNDGTVEIEWTDPLGRAVQINAKLMSPIRFNRRLKERFKLGFIMMLKATDPIIESQALFSEQGVRGYNMGNIKLATLMPTTMPIINEQTLTIDNGGSAETNTVIRMFGSTIGNITNPKIENLDTGKSMQLTLVLADETEFIEIDSKLGTIIDQDGNDVSGNLASGSEFVTLIVGSNELMYTSDENETENPVATRIEPDEVLQVEYRETII